MPRTPSFPMPLPAQAPGHRNAAPRPTQGKPPPGTYPAGLTSAARVQPRGCKGRSPLHKKTKKAPLPAGKGGKGDGGKKALLRQANPATEKVSPPADAATALFLNAAPGSSAGAPERRPPPRTWQAPAGHQQGRFKPVPPGFSPGNARGEAPCIRKLKTPPSPEGKGGRGDRGKQLLLRQANPATEKASPPPPQ